MGNARSKVTYAGLQTVIAGLQTVITTRHKIGTESVHVVTAVWLKTDE